MTVSRARCVSGDRDLMALATERVTILYTGRGVAKLEVLGPDEIRARFGVPAAHYADFAVLRGDASDGLPGVSGIGAKTAAALVVRFGTVEAILEAAHSRSAGFPAGAAAKVLAAEDYLLAAPAVVRGRTDAPIDAIDDAVPLSRSIRTRSYRSQTATESSLRSTECSTEWPPRGQLGDQV